MAKRYCVRLKTHDGMTAQEGVVVSVSPRSAIDTFCAQNNREVKSVIKYGSWVELRNAYIHHGGSCVPCEVFQLYGDRKNYYILYTAET